MTETKKYKIHLKNGSDVKTEISVTYYNALYLLIQELKGLNILERLNEISQLGLIKVKRKYARTRFDYVILQLYLNQLINDELKGDLKYSFGNKVAPEEFIEPEHNIKNVTVGEMIQLLIVLYNIGHFYNTFTGSRGLLVYLKDNEIEYNNLKKICGHKFGEMLDRIVDNMDYYHVRLLNSMLILNHCNHNEEIIKLCFDILYCYVFENELKLDSKLRFVFTIFRKIRSIAYISYDLQATKIPFNLDMSNRESVAYIFKELLSKYNNIKYVEDLMESINKLLDDVIYNASDKSIKHYNLSKIISKNLVNYSMNEYYSLFCDKNSVLNNCNFKNVASIDEDNILKVTFDKEHSSHAYQLLGKVEKMDCVKAGYYDRHHGEKTVLIALKKSTKDKIRVAFKVLKSCIAEFKSMDSCKDNITRILLCAKFFLYYLFESRKLTIESSVCNETPILCARGSKKRIDQIEHLLANSNATDDQKHEVNFMKTVLEKDCINDLAIMIPSSIVVYDNNLEYIELDGMIIFPNRKKNQIVFLEAKNTVKKETYGKNCLKSKFDKINLNYDYSNIVMDNHDAFYKHTI